MGRGNLEETDLPVFAGLETAREGAARAGLVEGRFLLAITARETTFHTREERVSDSGGGGAEPQRPPGLSQRNLRR